MLHLIVGNTGSGKTTYAKQLKQNNNAVLFSIDTWNKVLFFPDKQPTDRLDWFLERIERSEAVMMNLIEQLENSNTDSILDLGLSKFEHRDKFRAFANTHGYDIKLHYLDIPKQTRLERVMQRNTEQGDTFEFEVTRDDFEFMETWFEPPNEIEMTNGIRISK